MSTAHSTSSHGVSQETHHDVGIHITRSSCCKKITCKKVCLMCGSQWPLLVLFLIIVLYIVLGGVIFHILEGPAEIQSIERAMMVRNETIDELAVMLTWMNMSDADGIPFHAMDEFLELGAALAVATELVSRQHNLIWDYHSAVFFASTVITTIGYGSVAPTTPEGQIAFIFYAIIGIPLALMFIAHIGSIASRLIYLCLKPVEKCWGIHVSHALGLIIIFIIALIFFVLVPAAIYTTIEPWNYRESVYFTTVTLTTVGFGDFIPAMSTDRIGSSWITPIYTIASSIWLWLGLAMLSTFMVKVQELVYELAKWGKDEGICLKRKSPTETDAEELDVIGKQKVANGDPKVSQLLATPIDKTTANATPTSHVTTSSSIA